MRCAVWFAVGGLAGACGARDPVANGRLAYSDAAGGIVVVDLADGSRRTIGEGGGPAGSIALSPDGREMAFAREPAGAGRQVWLANLDTGSERRVQPDTGGQMPSFVWSDGGYFEYWRSAGAVSHWIVNSTSSTAHQLGGDYVRFVEMSTQLVAYDECTQDPSTSPCAPRLIVADPIGETQRELANGERVEPIGFSPDGSQLAVLEDVGDGTHLTVRSPVDGSPRDLGPADRAPRGFSNRSDARRVYSMDGSEILVVRQDGLAVVNVTSGAARTVTSTAVQVAEMLASGSVVYTIEENLTPNSDTPEFAYHLHVARPDGDAAVVQDAQSCGDPPVASVDRSLVAWSCLGHVWVIAVDTGSTVFELDGDIHVLGIDTDNGGLVAATLTSASPTWTYQLEHIRFDGETEILGEAAYDIGGGIEWPPFDFRP